MPFKKKRRPKSILKTIENRLQKAFGHGKSATLDQAHCLYKIQAQELFLSVAKTMGAYGKKQWGISPAYTSRLAAAGAVHHQLKSLWKRPGAVKPTSESQLRPLTLLDTKEERTEAWLKAAVWGNGTPTAKDVAIEVQTILRAKGAGITESPAQTCALKLNFKGKEYLYDYLMEKGKKTGLTPGEVAMETLELFCPVLPPVAPLEIEADHADRIELSLDPAERPDLTEAQAHLLLLLMIF